MFLLLPFRVGKRERRKTMGTNKSKTQKGIPKTAPQLVLATDCEYENGQPREVRFQVLDPDEKPIGTWIVAKPSK